MSEPRTEAGKALLHDHFRDEAPEDYNHFAFDIAAIEDEAIRDWLNDEATRAALIAKIEDLGDIAYAPEIAADELLRHLRERL